MAGKSEVNLVLQGPGASDAAAEHLARLTRPAAVDSIHAKVFRLRNATRMDVDAYCAEQKIDYAWMPEGRRFADLKLLAMDMDSTLITIECIDELGDFAGRKAEIAAITAQAMRGELDYPASLRQRVAALKGLEDSILSRVYEERLCLTPGAEALIRACKHHRVKLLLVSGGFTFFTDRLKQRLGIDYTISNRLEIRNGKLTGEVLGDIVDADAKAKRFKEVVSELKATKDESVAIGDGANDLKMMAQAGVSVAFRAKPVVRAQATCALNWSGLDGVVHLFE
jgi:phosphoserine phosphatase